MNLFLRELKANAKSLLIWSVCMVLLIGSGMGKYTAYSAGGASSAVFDKMPHSLKALIGMGDFDVTRMSGYFAMLFMYIVLTAAIHAVLLGSGIIAKEERDKTSEFLFTKPISRSTILTAKLFAGLVNILILNLVTFAASVQIVAAYNKNDDITGEITRFILSLLVVQILFLTLGAAIAAVSRNPKTAGSLATAVLFGSFIVAKITDLAAQLNFLNLLSPFKYFDYQKLVDGNGSHLAATLLSLLLVTGFVGATYVFYQKRDLSI